MEFPIYLPSPFILPVLKRIWGNIYLAFRLKKRFVVIAKAESCKTREKSLADLPQIVFFEGKQYDWNRIKMPANESSVESMNGEVEGIDLPSVKKAESCKTREKRLADLPQSIILEGKQYDLNRKKCLQMNRQRKV